MHRLKHAIFNDDIVPHHAKRICGRMCTNHFIVLIDHDRSQRKHGKQRIGGIIQRVVIGIVLVIIVAVRQRTPPRAQRFNHDFILAHS